MCYDTRKDDRMKEFYVANLRKDMEFTDFFMVKFIQLKTGSNGKLYLDLILGDSTGEISAKKWDISYEEQPAIDKIKEKDKVKIKGLVTEWAGQLQVRVQRIRPADIADNLDVKDYIKAAPEDPKDMFDYIHGVAEKFEDKDFKAICLKAMDDNKEKLLYYPGASRNHHAEYAGLLYHMKRMLMNGERVCDVYTKLNKDFVLCGVIMHDMEKLNEIDADLDGMSDGYTFEGQMLGHLVMGVKSIDKMALELDFPDEKRIMLEHMILSHHYEPEFGSPKKPLFPEAEVLHYLDILDAKLYDMEDALSNVEPGEFTEKIWTLDNRKIYKPEE